MRISISIILLVFIVGCKDSSTESSQNNQLLPLHIGNYWAYRFTSYDSSGNQNDLGILLSEMVMRDTIINGNKWSIVNMTSLFNIETPYINKSDGLHYHSNGTDYLSYKYPANIGDVFGDSIFVSGINQKVSSKVGNVNCIVYKKIWYDQTILWITTTTYFAPGVGKVKVEYYRSKDRLVWSKYGEQNLDACILN